MKQEYIKPKIQVVELEPVNTLSASFGFSDEEINTGGRAQERRGEWGNLWASDELEKQLYNSRTRRRTY